MLVQGVVEGLQGPFLANPAFQATASTPLPDQIAIQIFAIPMVAFVFHTFSMASARFVSARKSAEPCLHLLSQTKQEAT